ncbi:hypothetical protein ACK3BE_33420 (plasmid) [Pseudomonas mandelii]|uniref:hypothetical protein n=1 Tax=Pseudomonas mandelii TaxID=75612 RepID=UPI00398D467E
MSKTTVQMLQLLRTAMLDMDKAANSETVIAAYQYCKGYAQSMQDAGKIDAAQFGDLLREVAGHFEVGRARFPLWSHPNFE